MHNMTFPEVVMSSTELPEEGKGPTMDAGAPGSHSGDDEGSVAVPAILAAIGVLCVASALAYVVYRYFRKRSVHGMNFDNPVYKKTTTEDGFHLAGQQQQQQQRNNCPRPAPSQSQFQHRQYGVMSPEDSLEPLTNGSNNFV